MERLIQNISKLIARNNCVILPGAGAFLAHNVPASYNAEERVFMPPHRVLVFNPQVTADDALLLSEYLGNGCRSYDDATTVMSKDIAKLRKELSSKGRVQFGELGTFFMNVKNGISFEPAANGIDDPYNFGFEPIAIPLLSDCKEKEIVIKRHDFRRYITAAASVVVLFFLLAPFLKNTFEPSMQASVTDFASSLSTPAATTVVADLQPECEIAPVEETVTKAVHSEEVIAPVEEEPATVVLEPASSATYHIIVASSPNAENAQLAIEELSAKMAADYRVIEGSGRYRIVYGSYATGAEANDALSQIKATFPDAWVLTR